MYLKKEKFLIVGVSKSGTSACELLLSKGAKCFVYDDSETEAVKNAEKRLSEKGATIAYKSEVNELLAEITVVLLSPGVAIDHEIPVRAKKLGKRIIGELELAAELCVAPVIAVTGTNGKTTTCTMIDDILKNGGEKPILCGNVGTPFSSVLDKITDDTLVVLETSSFQLETVSRFAPHVAVITNITPDHLSRHYNMENYIYLKGKILANLRESEYAVLNYDDGIVREFGEKTRAKVVYFSAQNEVNGAYVSDDKIFYKGKYVADIKSLPVGGEHNILNLLAAVCVAEIVGMTEEAICSGIKEFKGVKHRIQYIRTVNGADYYNDSKATNADATMKAIDSMNKPTTLILGGKDKGLDFDALFRKISESLVKVVVLTGESAPRLYDSAKKIGYKNVYLANDFFVAVKLASIVAENGEAVLLSPACSSFDCFTDYEERGDRFIEIVEKL